MVKSSMPCAMLQMIAPRRCIIVGAPSQQGRAVVFEPFDADSGVWEEIPNRSFCIFDGQQVKSCQTLSACKPVFKSDGLRLAGREI